MSRRKASDPRTEALREHGALNPHPEAVADARFLAGGFFDPRDLVQVKYEMLRRSEVDGDPISRAATAFGFSRPSFYQAQAAFTQDGLAGLIPKKRGPRSAHKLTDDVMSFLEEVRREGPSQGPSNLTQRIFDRFGLRVHARSVERALRRQEKKRS